MRGLFHLPALLTDADVEALAEAARAIVREAPLVAPTMGGGTPFRLRVTSAGEWGWWADRGRYFYTAKHPTTGRSWPPLPQLLREVAARSLDAARAGARPADRDLLPRGTDFAPTLDSCLLNAYEPDGSLGWHVDRTEQDADAPIVSVSLGCSALFEIRDLDGAVERLVLDNGAVLIQAGPARKAEHRIARICDPAPVLFGPKNPLGPGRWNLTLRRNRKPVEVRRAG